MPFYSLNWFRLIRRYDIRFRYDVNLSVLTKWWMSFSSGLGTRSWGPRECLLIHSAICKCITLLDRVPVIVI